MKKYVYINDNNIVHEILDEFSSMFPDVHISKRYSEDILDKCLVFEDGQELPTTGYIYDKNSNTFSEPPVIVPDPSITKNARKIEIENELEKLDKKSIRDSEDILEALIKKGLLSEEDVPFVKTRKAQKQVLRLEAKGLE